MLNLTFTQSILTTTTAATHFLTSSVNIGSGSTLNCQREKEEIKEQTILKLDQSKSLFDNVITSTRRNFICSRRSSGN